MEVAVDSWTRFVPALVKNRLIRDGDLLEAAHPEDLTAAVLFADISGSTRITERFAARGQQGIEALSHVLNSFFGQLGDAIIAHGGDVLKFGGDALLAVWPVVGDADDQALATRRAAQCGLRAQSDLHGYVATEDLRLSIRIGIGVGTIRTVNLGGATGSWEYLIAGTPVVRSFEAQEQAEPGQVVLAPEAWDLVRDVAAGEILATGAGLLTSISAPVPVQPLRVATFDDRSATRLRAYAPRPILARLDAGQTDWLAELRRITILYVNLLHVDPVADPAAAQAVVYDLQALLARHDGHMARVGYDTKGLIMQAAFGLPNVAGAGDAPRGAAAALAIEEYFRQRGDRTAIGVATGRAFVGTVGNERWCAYTMFGDVANLGARLMQAAGDGVLCDAATFEVARGQFEFQAPSALNLKGKQAPVIAYRLVGQMQQRSAARTVLLGREREREILLSALHALRQQRQGSVVVIEGEPGIGKSRLVDDLCARAAADAVTTLIGSGDAIEASSPYHAWRAVFTQLLGLHGAPHDPDLRRAHILNHLQRLLLPSARPDDPARQATVSRLAPLIGPVLGLEWQDNAFTASLSGEARADNTHDLLCNVLRAFAQESPVLLIMEDLHWLDSASWMLLRRAWREVGSILFVFSTRALDEPRPREYLELIQDPAIRHLSLAPLSPEQTLLLLCDRLGVAEIPEPLDTLIHERVGGHPFFAEEVAYSLRDAGLIAVADGVCRIVPAATALLEQALPATIEGVIINRIDHLPASQQLALKVASVVGRTFGVSTVVDVYPANADASRLPSDIAALERLDITPLLTGEPDRTHIFKHAITHEVTYNLMLYAQRRRLHRAVGEWYERTYADALAGYFPLLAHHWSRAIEDPTREHRLTEKAIDYLERAGEQARRSDASREVVRFIDEAVRLETARGGAAPADGPARFRQARRERWLGEAYFRLGQPAEAKEHLRTALVLLGETAGAARPAAPTDMLGQLACQMLHLAAPKNLVRRLAPGSRDERRVAAEAYLYLNFYHYLAEDKLAMLYGYLRGLNLSEMAGPSPILAQTYGAMATLSSVVGLDPLAEHYHRQAFSVARDVDPVGSLYLLWHPYGLHKLARCEWRAAEESFHSAQRLAEAAGDQHWRETALVGEGVLRHNQGNISGALALWTEAGVSARRRGDFQMQTWSMVGAVSANVLLGRLDEALRIYGEIVDRPALLQSLSADPTAEVNLYAFRAAAHLRRGERARALEAIEGAGRLMDRHPSVLSWGVTGRGILCQVCLELHVTGRDMPYARRQQLLGFVARAVRSLQTFARAAALGRPQASLWRGAYDWTTGRRSRAMKTWQRALLVARRLALPYEEGLLHYQIGRHLPAGDPGRASHLRQAAHRFTAIGVPYELGLVRAVPGADSLLDL